MPHSYARFKRTLRVFLKAKADETPLKDSFNIQHASRDGRVARGIDIDTPGTPRRGGFDVGNNDSDDADYTPSSASSKKAAQVSKNKQGHNKRKADTELGGEKPAKAAKKGHTGEQSKEERLRDTNAFITLALTSVEARASLEAMAQEHQNDVTKRGLPRPRDGFGVERQTYLERLDGEALLIDNDGGKALRNRKVPDLQTCRKCKRLLEKCVCHEALMPRKEDTERRRLPSIVPIIAKENDFEERPPPINSAKGKQKAQSPTPASLLTPPPSSGRTSSSDTISSWRDTLSDSQPTAGALVSGKKFFHDGDGRVFVFDPAISPQTGSNSENDPGNGGNGDDTFQIVTRWGHPIDFKYIPKKSPPCRFCTEFLHGIMGENRRVVLVRRDAAAGGYVELGSESRVPRTQMCVWCALSRRYITACAGHKYAAINTPYDRQLYIKQLTRPHEAPLGPGEKPARDVCSICPYPAEFGCTAEQKYNLRSSQIPTPNRNGCGLRLCKHCRFMVATFPDGKLRLRAIRRYLKMESQKSKRPYVTRADLEFICEGGDLQSAYRRKQAEV